MPVTRHKPRRWVTWLTSILLSLLATSIFLAVFLLTVNGPLNWLGVGMIQGVAPASTDIVHLVIARYALGTSLTYFVTAMVAWLIRCGPVTSWIAALAGCRIGLAMLEFAVMVADNQGVDVGLLSSYLLKWPDGFQLVVMAAASCAALAGWHAAAGLGRWWHSPPIVNPQ